jgi:hypothetical protein
MSVSSGLQKYFDSQQKKKSQGDMKKKFDDLAKQIDPAFLASFDSFHDRILDIMEENPESEEVISDEISELDMQLQNSNKAHNMKKAAIIVSTSEDI